MASIQPFGTNTNYPTNNLQSIKLFGCTVVDFNVSADWSSQGGSLTCKLIEDQANGDNLIIPVVGTPVKFDLCLRHPSGNPNLKGEVVFQYVGIVQSFSRNASPNSKTYSVTLDSPLKILDSVQVILDGYAGLGSSIEGTYNLQGLQGMDFGHNNSLMDVLDTRPGVYHWWNVANLINVFGILENDDPLYRVPLNNSPLFYGGFGFSNRSKDGIPLAKVMWALHMGINHLPNIAPLNRSKTLGGNILFGRHNYHVYDQRQAIPYYYHFDALNFYNQVANNLDPNYRVGGQSSSIKEIISSICEEANLDYYTYIDIYDTEEYGSPIGGQTLAEYDVNFSQPAICNWINIPGLRPMKFTSGGNYGGTIRIQTVNRNSFINQYRPFSNIAYNLIGLEVPDLSGSIFANNNGIHPGKRPYNQIYHGVAIDNNYSEPLDSVGVIEQHGEDVTIQENLGYVGRGTSSVVNGGTFPVESSVFDPNYFDFTRVTSSDISLKLNDATTLKVITGGYQSRIVSVPGRMIRHYWGDITLADPLDPRSEANTETDEFGLNERSSRKIPIVTPLLDPRDIDDYILIDMKTLFGDYSCPGVFQNGIYAASLLEIRCAMKSQESWKAFMEKFKYQKLRNLFTCFYPYCGGSSSSSNINSKKAKEELNQEINASGGLGYVGCSHQVGLGNEFSLSDTAVDGLDETINKDGTAKHSPHVQTSSGTGPFGLGIDIPCASAKANLKKYLLPAMWEMIKDIGDTHYGKSWYAPVPYLQSIQNLDGESLVGDFKRSWELTDSAYVEPSLYYPREIPQSNLFVSDGKVSAFVNWDHNFITGNGQYDKSYADEITNFVGQTGLIFNFSEYDLDQLCFTKYGNFKIIHTKPQSIESEYSFLPFAYDRLYSRAYLPYSDIITGQSKRFDNDISEKSVAPLTMGQGTEFETSYMNDENVPSVSGVNKLDSDNKSFVSNTGVAKCAGEGNSVPEASGYFNYNAVSNMPALTNTQWLNTVVQGLQSLDYEDNGRFCFPFVKFTTNRTFLPVPSPMSLKPNYIMDGFNAFVGANLCQSGNPIPLRRKQFTITSDHLISILNPFQACVSPRSISYPQISTRYVYGPWMTSYNSIEFRGKIEYEQDTNLVPENFLVPIRFHTDPENILSLDQTSGFTGMNLAAQAKANAIDNFNLFAVEEGTITIPGAPSIRRIGDSFFGIQQVTDIKINITNENIETTYGFKTISPRFGKNTRELEKNLNKISNQIKNLKLR